MPFDIVINSDDSRQAWNSYVRTNDCGTLYHLYEWKDVICNTYKHKAYYLLATSWKNDSALDVVGILPLVHIKHFLFGNSLISIPFFDLGGILADNDEVAKSLLAEALNLGKKLGVTNIELRHTTPLAWLPDSSLKEDKSQLIPSTLMNSFKGSAHCLTLSHKVRMLLDLPQSAETLMKSFKSKLRSQIKKPIKAGLSTKIGGPDLLEDFYNVFTINMRDLGSPVHSKSLVENVLKEFEEEAKIIVVYKDNNPIAGSLVIGFNITLENPWASSLREHSRLSPNMLLYWTMLEYACNNGYRFFDFGRSTPNEGTYKFKEQWGAKPTFLHWHSFKFEEFSASKSQEKSKFEKFIRYWQKLPIPATKIIGPLVRKNIGL